MKELEFNSDVLFEFAALVDLDLALLKYIQINFPESKFFNKTVMKSDEYTLKCLLVTRKKSNPLSVIIEDEYVKTIDSLYEDLLSKKEEEILKFATPLSTFSLFNTIRKSDGGIRCVVNCKNVVEEQFIKSLINDVMVITDSYTVPISKYAGYYIKNVEDTFKYKFFDGKAIYYLDYDYNIQPNRKDRMPLFDIAGAISRTNNIFLVSPYTNLELPK